MFNAIRIGDAPSCCVNKTSYKSQDVLTKLNAIFHGKRYICETKGLQSPRVEHRIPHRGDEELIFDWDNLFLSCERCNNIKSDDFSATIDCCSDIVINDLIFIQIDYAPRWELKASPKVSNPSVELIGTIKLINECCNKDNTPTRKLSKKSLMDDINEAYCLFMSHKVKIIKGNEPLDEINKSKGFIINMCSPSYPFSAIWHGMISCDQDLQSILYG